MNLGPFRSIGRFRWLWASLLAAGAAAACNEPTPPNPAAGCREQPPYYGLFVLNEGSMGQSPGALTYFDEAGGHCRVLDLFRRTTGEESIGDVAQSVLRVADTLYIVVTNSRYVYKLQLPTFALLEKLNLPAPSGSAVFPRELAVAGPNRAYLTNLGFSGQLYLLSLSPLAVVQTIDVGPHQEGIFVSGGKAFVALSSYTENHAQRQIAVVNTSTHTLQDTILLPATNPGYFAPAPGGKLWVSVRGDYNAATPGLLVRLNPTTATIDTALHLPANLFGRLAVMQDSFLLFSHGNPATSMQTLGRLNLHTLALDLNYLAPSQLGLGQFEFIYAFAWDAQRGQLLVSTQRGVTNGRLFLLSPSLQVRHTLETGVFPGTLFWVR